MGALEAPQTEFNRIKVEGAIFTIDDVPYVTNPKTGAPAFTARIIEAPDQYQALWHDDEIAELLDRPEAAGRFCKSHFNDPDQARKFSNLGFDCNTCPAKPWGKDSPLPNGRKCQWKGDLKLQIVDPETGQFFTRIDAATGEITSDDRIWTLSLSTTAMIEWQGTAKDSVRGNVSDMNTMHKLAQLGVTKNPDDPKAGIVAAINALGLGLVIAEFRSLKASNADGSRTWYVPSATPIDILVYDETPQLPAGDPLASDPDDVPF
jgi:hypothetical protein